MRQWQSRIDRNQGAGAITLLIWYAVAVLFLLAAPARLKLGATSWALDARDASQFTLWVMAFLGYSLWLTISRSRHGRLTFVAALLGAAVCWGLAAGLLVARASLPLSRSVAIVMIVAGSLLAALPFLLRQAQLIAASVLLASAVLGIKLEKQPPPDGSMTTALYRLAISQERGLIPPQAANRGGGIALLNDGFLVVTGSGEFFRLRWNGERTHLTAAPLAASAPLGLREFLAEPFDVRLGPLIRVTDLYIDTLHSPARVLISHQHWNHAASCYSMRVSAASLSEVVDGGATPPQWQTVYETHPCLAANPAYDVIETGGRLLRLDASHLLFTVGDHGFNGVEGPPLAQDTLGDYGKILVLDDSGHRAIFSIGHRNPQGLAIDHAGRIWETEHGPQGGDEINVIERGGNYGWPLETYGTQYGAESWPLSDQRRDRTALRPPAYAFVPSIGVSNLIELGDSQFPRWNTDLLVATLTARQLLRIRTLGTQVVYAEPITIGQRIRDLVQDRDGTIVLWTDSASVILIRADRRETGENLFAMKCSGCHGGDLSGTRLGPSLRGVTQRRMASQPDFVYSAALTRRKQKWSKVFLDEFLRDPQHFAPGTAMRMSGLTSYYDRVAVIEYLRTHH